MNNTEKWLSATLAGWQDLENTLIEMIAQRDLEQAEGAQLDQLGALVKQRRDGRDNETYRRFIRARIATLKSSGLPEQVIRVARLVLGPDYAPPTARLVYDNVGEAGYVLRVEDAVVDETLAEILVGFLRPQGATAGGVRAVLQHGAHDPPSEWFRWDDGPGWDSGYWIDELD